MYWPSGRPDTSEASVYNNMGDSFLRREKCLSGASRMKNLIRVRLILRCQSRLQSPEVEYWRARRAPVQHLPILPKSVEHRNPNFPTRLAAKLGGPRPSFVPHYLVHGVIRTWKNPNWVICVFSKKSRICTLLGGHGWATTLKET